MAGPRAPALLALSVLAAALGGCFGVDGLDGLFDRLEGAPRFEEVPKLREELAFGLADTDTGAVPPAGKRASYAFAVPPGARDLRVEAAVTFEPPEGLPAALPGSVNVTVSPPQGAPRSWSFTEDGSQVLREPAPAPGTWRVEVHAIGEGVVRLFAACVQQVA